MTADKLMYFLFMGVFFSMPLGTSPALICGALAFLVWIFSGMAMQIRPFFRQTWFWPVLVFILLPWIGLLYTPDPAGFGIEYARKTHYWLYCLTLASLSFEVFRPERLIWAFLIGLALNSCVGVTQLIGILPPKQGFFSGLARGYNTVSAYLVLGILISAFYVGKANGQKRRLTSSLVMLLCFFHLVILEGRTGYFTFLMLAPFIIKTIFRRLSILKVFLVCALIAGLMSLSPIVRKRVYLSVNQLQYHMNAKPSEAWGREYPRQHQDRFYMWYGAIQIIMENPLFGLGTGGYPTVLKEMRKPDDPIIAHPHNSILYMAVSYGIIGILGFAWLFWEMIRNGLRQRNTTIGHFLLSTALVVLVSGLFNTTILDSGMLFLLAVAVGIQRALPMFALPAKKAICSNPQGPNERQA